MHNKLGLIDQFLSIEGIDINSNTKISDIQISVMNPNKLNNMTSVVGVSIDVVPDLVIWTVNWIHYLNCEVIPHTSCNCHWFVQGTSYVRPSHPTDGVTAFHMSVLSLDCSQDIFTSNRLYE